MGAAVLMFLILAVTLSTVQSCLMTQWVCTGKEPYEDECFRHECIEKVDHMFPKVDNCTQTEEQLQAMVPEKWFEMQYHLGIAWPPFPFTRDLLSLSATKDYRLPLVNLSEIVEMIVEAVPKKQLFLLSVPDVQKITSIIRKAIVNVPKNIIDYIETALKRQNHNVRSK